MSTKPTPSSLHTFCTCVLIAILLLQFLYSSPLPPIIGNIPDNKICPIRASLSVLINLLYFPTMADVPSFSALFVPTCTRTALPVPPPMTCPAFAAISFIFAPGRHTVISSPLFIIVSTFLIMEYPINTRAFLAFPCDTTSAKLLSCRTLCPLCLLSSTFTVLPPGNHSPLTRIGLTTSALIFLTTSALFFLTLPCRHQNHMS